MVLALCCSPVLGLGGLGDLRGLGGGQKGEGIWSCWHRVGFGGFQTLALDWPGRNPGLRVVLCEFLSARCVGQCGERELYTAVLCSPPALHLGQFPPRWITERLPVPPLGRCMRSRGQGDVAGPPRKHGLQMEKRGLVTVLT